MSFRGRLFPGDKKNLVDLEIAEPADSGPLRLLYFRTSAEGDSAVEAACREAGSLLWICSDLECVQLVSRRIEMACCLIDVDISAAAGNSMISQARSAAMNIPMVALITGSSIAETTLAVKGGADMVLERPFSPESLQVLEELTRTYFDQAKRQMPEQEFSVRLAEQLGLTEKQRFVAELVMGGLSTKEIAREMDISPRTVDAHRGRVMRKAGAKNATDLVRMALEYQEFR